MRVVTPLPSALPFTPRRSRKRPGIYHGSMLLPCLAAGGSRRQLSGAVLSLRPEQPPLPLTWLRSPPGRVFSRLARRAQAELPATPIVIHAVSA